MIGYLSGRVLWKAADGLVLLVGGVGYQLECPASTIWALPRAGEEAALFVSMVVREDAIRLFGFVTQIDKMVFETLISVTSVGPKLALALMGPMGGSELVEALHARDERRLLAVPGVGQRKLEKLLVEMGPKLERLWAACQSLGSERGDGPALVGASARDHDLPVDAASGTESEGSGAATLANATVPGLSGASATHSPERHLVPSPGPLAPLMAVADERRRRRDLLADLESALTNIGHRDKFIRPCLDWVERQWDAGSLVVGLEESLRALLQRESARFVTSDGAAEDIDRVSSGREPQVADQALPARASRSASRTGRLRGRPRSSEGWNE